MEEKTLDCLDPKRKGYIDLKETKAMLETFGFNKPSYLYSVLADCERDKKAKEVKHETLLKAFRGRQLTSAQQRGNTRLTPELENEILIIKEQQHSQQAAIQVKPRPRSIGKF